MIVYEINTMTDINYYWYFLWWWVGLFFFKFNVIYNCILRIILNNIFLVFSWFFYLNMLEINIIIDKLFGKFRKKTKTWLILKILIFSVFYSFGYLDITSLIQLIFFSRKIIFLIINSFHHSNFLINWLLKPLFKKY